MGSSIGICPTAYEYLAVLTNFPVLFFVKITLPKVIIWLTYFSEILYVECLQLGSESSYKATQSPDYLKCLVVLLTILENTVIFKRFLQSSKTPSQIPKSLLKSIYCKNVTLGFYLRWVQVPLSDEYRFCSLDKQLPCNLLFWGLNRYIYVQGADIVLLKMWIAFCIL